MKKLPLSDAQLQMKSSTQFRKLTSLKTRLSTNRSSNTMTAMIFMLKACKTQATVLRKYYEIPYLEI